MSESIADRRRATTAVAVVLVLTVGGCAGPDATRPAVAASPGATATASRPSQSTASPSPTRELSASASSSPQAVAARWSRVLAGGAPRAREDHTWTVGGDGSTAFLFGGRDGSTVFGDLFAYDLGADRWRRLTPAGPRPTARFGHEAVWVDGVGLVVFAGQAGPTTFFDDLWAFDPSTGRWAKLPSRGARPVARYGSCSALGPDGRLWISHGFTAEGSRFSDTRAYDFGSGSWTDETPAGQTPVERCLHACFFADDGRFVLYAGQTTGVEALGDLWALDGPGTASAAWTRVTGVLPAERNLYAFARLGGAWLVVGGRGPGPRYLSDAHLLDATNLAVTSLRVPGPRPAGRAGATLIADRDRALLFGGTDAGGGLRDLWRLDLGGALG